MLAKPFTLLYISYIEFFKLTTAICLVSWSLLPTSGLCGELLSCVKMRKLKLWFYCILLHCLFRHH